MQFSPDIMRELKSGMRWARYQA